MKRRLKVTYWLWNWLNPRAIQYRTYCRVGRATFVRWLFSACLLSKFTRDRRAMGQKIDPLLLLLYAVLYEYSTYIRKAAAISMCFDPPPNFLAP